MRDGKSANSVLFKDFYDEAEMKKNKLSCLIYLVIVPYQKLPKIKKQPVKGCFPKILLSSFLINFHRECVILHLAYLLFAAQAGQLVAFRQVQLVPGRHFLYQI